MKPKNLISTMVVLSLLMAASIVEIAWAEQGISAQRDTSEPMQGTKQIESHREAIREALLLSGFTESVETIERLHRAARGDALDRIGTAAAERDVDKSLALARQMVPGVDRSNFLQGIFSKWAETDPKEAANHLLTMSADEKQTLVSLAQITFSKWAQANPRAAATYLRTIPVGRIKEVALLFIVTKWAEADPQSAAAWVQELPENRECNGIVSVIGMAGHVSLEGILFCRSHAMQAVAFQWAKSDPEAALAWAETLTNGEIQGHVRQMIDFRTGTNSKN